MKCNVGGADRTIRAAIGTVLAAEAIVAPMSPGRRLALLAPAGIAFFTVLSRYCPLNDAIGLDTCQKPTSRLSALTLFPWATTRSP